MRHPTANLWFAKALLPEGWRESVRIVIEGTRIADVRPDTPPLPADKRCRAALPGLSNLHSHAFQRAMAGLAEVPGTTGQDSFWSWREAMYRLVARLNPADVAAIAAMAFVEMMEGGFVRVGEFHYLHHQPDGSPYADLAEMSAAIVHAAEISGIALTLLPVFYNHADFGGAPPLDQQRRFVNSIDEFEQLLAGARQALASLPDGVLGVAPHSLRAVTPGELSRLGQLLPAAPVHIHIAEQTAEVDASIAWSGARPVAWLLDNAQVDARWCLVHATHVEYAELRGIADSGAVVGLCPVTEANLGDGTFPAREFVKLGGRYGIGSDSNVRIGAADELQLLEYGQRLVMQQRNVMARHGQSTGRSLFEMAAAGGAQALGVEHGGLRVGAAADIVGLEAGPAGNADQFLDQWIFGPRSNSVCDVWRAGHHIVRDGRHVRRDAVEATFARTMMSLADQAL